MLFQLVGLCHGDGLVDADLEEFVRWVVDEGWVCGSSVMLCNGEFVLFAY